MVNLRCRNADPLMFVSGQNQRKIIALASGLPYPNHPTLAARVRTSRSCHEPDIATPSTQE
jgi:hypothetical protein